jgi:hypothetical protein
MTVGRTLDLRIGGHRVGTLRLLARDRWIALVPILKVEVVVQVAVAGDVVRNAVRRPAKVGMQPFDRSVPMSA